jgi:hypothetical protein
MAEKMHIATHSHLRSKGNFHPGDPRPIAYASDRPLIRLPIPEIVRIDHVSCPSHVLVDLCGDYTLGACHHMTLCELVTLELPCLARCELSGGCPFGPNRER